jgi:hypothetical protein
MLQKCKSIFSVNFLAMNENDLKKLYDTVMSIPGMNESVKIDLRIPRKNVLLISKLIQRGLPGSEKKGGGGAIVEGLSQDCIKELQDVSKELLTKAWLTEMNEKLDSF